MSRTVLVVAAHADDEALGCGGALGRHARSGDRVLALHLTDGVGSRQAGGRKAVAERRRASEEAASVLGFEWIGRGDFPDNELDTVPLLEVVRFVEERVTRFAPDVVYTHHGGDLNVDHRLAFRATLTALRPEPDAPSAEIRAFEVPSSTEWSHRSVGPAFTPNLFLDIVEDWERKREALRCYEPELRSAPHPRSLEAVDALTRWRGAQGGLERAEAFEIVRRVV